MDIILDASASRDPDLDPSLPQVQLLSYPCRSALSGFAHKILLFKLNKVYSATILSGFDMIQALTFAWSCTVSNLMGSLSSSPCSTVDGQPLVLSPGAIIAVPAGILAQSAPGRPYRFSATVSKPGRSPASTTTLVNLRAAHLPGASATPVVEASAILGDGSVRYFFVKSWRSNPLFRTFGAYAVMTGFGPSKTSVP